jgi:hypothetical protein
LSVLHSRRFDTTENTPPYVKAKEGKWWLKKKSETLDTWFLPTFQVISQAMQNYTSPVYKTGSQAKEKIRLK